MAQKTNKATTASAVAAQAPAPQEEAQASPAVVETGGALLSRLSLTREQTAGCLFALCLLPLKGGKPVYKERKLLFFCKSLSACCIAGNSFALLCKKQGYSLDKKATNSELLGGKPFYKLTTGEGQELASFPVPFAPDSKEALAYKETGLPFVDRTTESLEAFLKAQKRLVAQKAKEEAQASQEEPQAQEEGEAQASPEAPEEAQASQEEEGQQP